MGDLEDFGELYADLEDRVIVGVPTAKAEEEVKNETEVRGAGHENGAVESGRSSDSEDDLRIVLNEEDYGCKFPSQFLAEGRDFEKDEGDDLVIVTGSGCYGNDHSRAEHVHSTDGLLQENGDSGDATKGAHRNWSRPRLAGSTVRAWNSLSRRTHCDHLGKTSYNSGFPMEFSDECDFYLPRNRSIFNIDIESFECKPWRFNGVDISDYFNFGLDEEGWKTYCSQLVHFQQNKLPLHESSKLNKPKGQAIRVESGNGDRIPSIDVRRPRNRDSDVVIQITTGLAVEDALDPIINRITHMDDNGSKNELLLNSKNELCKRSFNLYTGARKCEGTSNSTERPCPHTFTKKPFDEKLGIMNCGRDYHSSIISSSKPDAIIAGHHSISPKPSDHKGSSEASRVEVTLEKVPSPEFIHLNSDSLLQESVLSHCYPSSETGSVTNRTDRTSCGDHSPESLLDLNYYQTAPCKVVELNHSSDDEVDFPLVHRQEIDGERQSKESGTIVRRCDDEPDERVLSSQEGKISLMNNIKYNNGKEVNAAASLAHSKGNEDPSLGRYREKRTAREVTTRKNGCYNNQRARRNTSTHDIVIRDYLQTPRSSALNDKMVCRTSRRLDGHGMITSAHYNSVEAKLKHREISLKANREGCLYFDEEEESFIDKHERVPCSAGALRRVQEIVSHYKTLPVNLESSSRYVCYHEDSRLYEDGLHSRIYREASDVDKIGWNVDDSHRNHVHSLFKSDKRNMRHSGHSHARETSSQLRSNHDIITSNKSHLISREGFNFNDDQFPVEVRKAYPGNGSYNESRKSSLALPGLIAKEEASIRHQDSDNLSCPKRYSHYGTEQLQHGRLDKSSFNKEKIYDNHLHNSRENKLTVKSGKDSDSGGRVGSLLDNFVKDRRELDNRGYRQAVRKHLNGWKVKTKEKCTSGDRSQLGTDITSFNETKSNYSSKVECSNHCMTAKNSNKHPINEEELEEFEEGQLIEESSSHETAEIKCNSDGRTPGLTANAKIDLADSIKKNKLAAGYDRNHLLETMAKMEKRRERFKDPIPLKKEPESCGSVQPVAAIEDEVKQLRPARKRRWGSS